MRVQRGDQKPGSLVWMEVLPDCDEATTRSCGPQSLLPVESLHLRLFKKKADRKLTNPLGRRCEISNRCDGKGHSSAF